MTCDQVGAHLVDYVCGGLAESEAAAIGEHLKGCRPCHRHYEDLSSTGETLRPAAGPSAVPPPAERRQVVPERTVKLSAAIWPAVALLGFVVLTVGAARIWETPLPAPAAQEEAAPVADTDGSESPAAREPHPPPVQTAAVPSPTPAAPAEGAWDQRDLPEANELQRADDLRRNGRLTEALAAYSAWLNRFASSLLVPDALLGRARCLRSLGAFARAREDLLQFTARAPHRAGEVRDELQTVEHALAPPGAGAARRR
jgi:hypothetical protein